MECGGCGCVKKRIHFSTCNKTMHISELRFSAGANFRTSFFRGCKFPSFRFLGGANFRTSVFGGANFRTSKTEPVNSDVKRLTPLLASNPANLIIPSSKRNCDSHTCIPIDNVSVGGMADGSVDVLGGGAWPNVQCVAVARGGWASRLCSSCSTFASRCLQPTRRTKSVCHLRARISMMQHASCMCL